MGDWDVSVVVPSVPGREHLLARALKSVAAQTYVPERVEVRFDFNGSGPGPTRNRALEQVQTPWVAFLDDDDELLPDHLKLLVRRARLTDADLVWPQPEYVGGWPDGMGVPSGFDFDPDLLRQVNYIPITVLVRTELLRKVGGFPAPNDAPLAADDWPHPAEDWACWLKLLDIGARFVPLHKRTWRWYWHAGQHKGRPA